ncbi:unnamed protein product [Acanthoscelides obtectus]|uniref:Uncharacterized protein n=1 Tax=Acanthoscelides obtectus TaxID=200917 RepID=A0A9P0MLA3_ACAOB|nr:unnamed protein product [Acanthoscelides obtectus]CAK1687826.1 hypothetical protein AOBTE_LOCUS36392 [Acanthoscelides obtectus]
MSYEAEQLRLQKLWQELLSEDEIDDEDLFGETSADEYQPSDNTSDSDSDSGKKRRKSEKSGKTKFVFDKTNHLLRQLVYRTLLMEANCQLRELLYRSSMLPVVPVYNKRLKMS